MTESKQQKSIIDRVISMETLILLAGLFSLGSGYYTGEPMQYFWGGMILTGAVALHFVRKKDWKKHWEEEERIMQQRKQREEREKENASGH